MLIGSGMEHIVGFERREDLLHSLLLADRGHHGLCLDVGELLMHHQADIMLRCLGLVYQHHLGRTERGHLTYHLRTDTTCRTGDQHTLTMQQLSHRIQVNLDLTTWQQVFYRHLFQLYALEVIFCQLTINSLQLLGTLSHKYLTARLDQQVLHLLVITEILHTLWRHEDSLDMLFCDDRREVIIHIIHITTHQLHVLGTVIMRDKASQQEFLWTL